MATLAPSDASRFAMAAPIPREAPVTRANLPSSLFDIEFLLFAILLIALNGAWIIRATSGNDLNESSCNAIVGCCSAIAAAASYGKRSKQERSSLRSSCSCGCELQRRLLLVAFEPGSDAPPIFPDLWAARRPFGDWSTTRTIGSHKSGI